MGGVKNPNDPRYVKNHQQFFLSLNRLLLTHPSLSLRPHDLYHRAKLCKSTFFQHFRSLDHALRCQSATLLAEFRQESAHFLHPPTPGSPPRLQPTFSFLCVFVLRHSDFFTAAFSRHHPRLLHQILWELRPHLTSHWPPHGEPLTTKLYLIYSTQLTLILQDWCQHKFHKTQLDPTISRLIATSKFFSAHLPFFCHLAELEFSSAFQPESSQQKAGRY